MPMYNLLEYSSNYSDPTGSLWFYSNDEATNFDNNNIATTNNFQTFVYKTKSLGSTVMDGENEVLRNAATAVSLKYLNSFVDSLKCN